MRGKVQDRENWERKKNQRGQETEQNIWNQEEGTSAGQVCFELGDERSHNTSLAALLALERPGD